MLKKISGVSSTLLLTLILSGCATPPPDVPICVEVNPGRGRCTYTISSGDITIDDTHLDKNGKTWWDLRPSMVLLPYESWEATKKFIIDICKKTNQCGSSVTSWDRTVNVIDSQIQTKVSK